MSYNYTSNENLLRYLDNELGPDEKSALETALQGSPVLQQELDDLKLSKYVVTRFGIRDSVQQIHSEFKNKGLLSEKKKTPVIRRLIPYMAAAAVAIFMLIIFYPVKNNSPETLYAGHFRKFEISNIRGSGFNTTEKLFAEKNYRALTEAFEKNTAPDGKDRFLAAQSYSELGETEKAIHLYRYILEQNKNQQTILYNDDAAYYLGMLYLKKKDIPNALEILAPIASNKKHLYSDIVDEPFIAALRKLK
jgi:tetratricopeptide (TPR) repeat protein